MLRILKRVTSIILITSLLQGCGIVTSDRIYSVCKVDGDKIYCYNTENSFFLKTKNNFVPTSSVRLKALPALHVIPKDLEYEFTSVIPGLYTGTLYDVDGYVYSLQRDYDGVLEVSYADWNNLDIKVHCTDFDVRVLYNITGEVRIYARKGGEYLDDIPNLLKN